MLLHSFASRTPKQGDVVVYFKAVSQGLSGAALGLIETVEDEWITVGPFGPLAGDDDGEEFLKIPVADAQHRLGYPQIEVGDSLIHRGRPACVRETQQYDWHVKIEYSDSAGGEFYGNVIWMDFQPTLKTLKQL